MVIRPRVGQNIQNLKPILEKLVPKPKNSEPEKPEPLLRFQPTVPEIITGNLGTRSRYPNYPNNPNNFKPRYFSSSAQPSPAHQASKAHQSHPNPSTLHPRTQAASRTRPPPTHES